MNTEPPVPEDLSVQEQLAEVQRLSADLEEIRQVAASPAVAAAVRGALVQLHLAAQFLGDDRIAAAFELEPPPPGVSRGAAT